MVRSILEMAHYSYGNVRVAECELATRTFPSGIVRKYVHSYKAKAR